jgi:hypothetical protein
MFCETESQNKGASLPANFELCVCFSVFAITSSQSNRSASQPANLALPLYWEH